MITRYDERMILSKNPDKALMDAIIALSRLSEGEYPGSADELKSISADLTDFLLTIVTLWQERKRVLKRREKNMQTVTGQ